MELHETARLGPTRLFIAFAFIAYAGAGTVADVPISGGAATTLTSGLRNPTAIAVDATSINVANDVSRGSVVRLPLVGGNAIPLAIGQHAPSAIAADSTSIDGTNPGEKVGQGRRLRANSRSDRYR
jgi:hypothetical protein